MKQAFNYMTITALITSFMLIQGCATSVSKLSADGKTDTIIFPNIEKSAWVKEGTFPNIDNLRNVAPNMTKTQLYALLGNPHFAEGFGKVREWDYIFNFRQKAMADTQICQYKIIYNPYMRLQSTYWKPESWANWLNTPQTQAQSTENVIIEKIVDKQVPGPELTKIQMSADGMFDFNKSDITNLRPGGVEKLNRVATNLLSGGVIVQLKIVGHSDRLGNDAYNIKLSQARAQTIRQYLVMKNVPIERITAIGLGKSEPLVECHQNKRDEALIRCLEPNRRFEIEAWTLQLSKGA